MGGYTRQDKGVSLDHGRCHDIRDERHVVMIGDGNELNVSGVALADEAVGPSSPRSFKLRRSSRQAWRIHPSAIPRGMALKISLAPCGARMVPLWKRHLAPAITVKSFNYHNQK
jgi:hypothetical protein